MKDAPILNPEKWVDLYGDMLFRFAFQRVRDSGIAEDLVQETLLAAMKSKGHFQAQSTEKTWLFAILKHKIIDYFRNKNNKATANVEIENFAEAADSDFNENGTWRTQPRSWEANPQEVYEKKEFWDAFYQCLSKIPKRLAEAFVFREIDGLSVEDICKKLGISATNCGVMLYRARMSLRGCIDIFYSAK
jgi:RNA polymerase sigma-70 factor (TIGR02943 family)